MTSFRKHAALLALLLAPAAFAAELQKPVEPPALPQAAAFGPGASIPGALGPSAAAPEAGSPASAAAAVEGAAKAVAPEAETIAAPASSDADAASAARSAQTILEGGKAPDAAAVLAGPSAPAQSGLSAAAPAAKTSVEPPAPAPRGEKVDDDGRYESRRRALRAIAATYDVVASLPQAGPGLTDRVLARAAGKKGLLSDIDDTLVKYRSGPLEPETVRAIAALRRAGKVFAAITDRPDKGKPGTESAFDTLSSIPAAERAGMYVSTDKGGKLYQYDAQGEPTLVSEEPRIEGAERQGIEDAAEAAVARLPSLGTSLVLSKGSDYGHVIIVELGTPMSVVTKVAEAFQQALDEQPELKKLGLRYQVHGQLSKDPAKDAPYVFFSKLSKAGAVKRILEAAKLQGSDVALMGDSMYRPKLPKQRTPDVEAIIAKARQLSGQDIPETGNDTDRDMEAAVPGALALSVGGSADPRMAQAFVLDGKGPPMSRRVIEAMAAGPRPPVEQAGLRDLIPGLLIIAMLFASIAGLIVWTRDALPAAERFLHEQPQDFTRP